VTAATFKVHYQATTPSPSWTAWKHWRTGRLAVYVDRAEFESTTGERVLIGGVKRVDQPSRRQLRREHDASWMVNTWIAVHYATPDGPAVAYFNDARLAPFGHYLSHGDMRQRLADLVGAEGHIED